MDGSRTQFLQEALHSISHYSPGSVLTGGGSRESSRLAAVAVGMSADPLSGRVHAARLRAAIKSMAVEARHSFWPTPLVAMSSILYS